MMKSSPSHGASSDGSMRPSSLEEAATSRMASCGLALKQLAAARTVIGSAIVVVSASRDYPAA